MARRTALALVLASLAVAAPPTAHAVPVPLDGCAPAAVAAAVPCRPSGDGESALAAAARSGADVFWKVLSTASFGLF
jgi:hypothetical protein